jgi:uncharacterized protein with FMN-binding domain
MKKYIIPIVVVVAFGIYVLLNSQKSVTVATPVIGSASTSGGSAGSGTSASENGSSSSVAAGSPTPGSGAYKDGTYTGSVENAFYGNLQVVAVISGGAITDVQFPVYPNESGHTEQVSNTDLPVLKQEAIQAQSSDVNIVSGATQTSQAFQQSLASALAMAKN